MKNSIYRRVKNCHLCWGDNHYEDYVQDQIVENLIKIVKLASDEQIKDFINWYLEIAELIAVSVFIREVIERLAQHTTLVEELEKNLDNIHDALNY